MTRAVTLAEIADEQVLSVDSTNSRIGIGSTTPTEKLDVVGVVSATSFFGDGSNLSGITAGATLSAGSGDQRVVLTSLTSGTMTAAATDAELTYNSGTNTLSATTFSGDLTGNVTGDVTGNVDGNVSGEVTLEGTAPTLATDPGVAGDIRYDANYVYICTATNTWVRAALSTW